MNKKLRLILFISLALNFALVGVTAGRYIKNDCKHKPYKTIAKSLEGKVSKDKIILLEEAMNANYKKNKQVRAEVKDIHKRLAEIMTAPEFSAEAFSAKLKELEILKGTKFRNMGKTLLEIVPQLSQEERVALSDFLEKNRPQHYKEHKIPTPAKD